MNCQQSFIFLPQYVLFHGVQGHTQRINIIYGFRMPSKHFCLIESNKKMATRAALDYHGDDE